MNELAQIDEYTPAAVQPMNAAQVVDQVRTLHSIMKEVMKEGVHYGKIPGCGDKNTLLKAGAEKIALAFHLHPSYTVESIRTGIAIQHVVTCRLTTPEGMLVAEGIGEASTDETKFAWKEAVCDAEFQAFPVEMRRTIYKRGRNSNHYTVNQVRTNPADVANSVLKYAKKRAFVDAVITATAAGDILSQDLEDLEEVNGDGFAPAAPAPQPQRASARQPQAPPQYQQPAAPYPTPQAPAPQQQAPAAAPVAQPQRASAPSAPGAQVIDGMIDRPVSKKPTSRGSTRYGISVNGVWYNTFSDSFGQQADGALAVQLPVQITYHVGQWGNDIDDLVVAQPPEDQNQPPLRNPGF